MSIEALPFELAENEQVVRSYQATRLRKLIFPPTIGFLTLTNMRVLFHSAGKSLRGRSQVISQLPLEDVSGIQISYSSSFNWILFLLFSGITQGILTYLTANLPQWMTGWVVSILLLLPYAAIWVYSSRFISNEIRETIQKQLSETTFSSFFQKEHSLLIRILRVCFIAGSLLFGWNLISRTDLDYKAPFIGIVLMLGIYFLIFRNILGSLSVFSLKILSKSSKGTGIVIPGNAYTLLVGDIASLESMNASPDIDAQDLVSDLGAAILDLQALGEMGINKWRK